MKIEIFSNEKTYILYLPAHLLLNNLTALIVTRHSGGALRFRDVRRFKKGVYRVQKEMPDWNLVEVTGKDGEEKVKIRL